MRKARLFGMLTVAVVLAGAAGATASCSAERHAQHHRLDMRDLTFQPPGLHVAPGDTVSWVNRDIVPHTVTATDARWDSGEVPPGGAFTVVVADGDTIRYECRYHPTMVGTLQLR